MAHGRGNGVLLCNPNGAEQLVRATELAAWLGGKEGVRRVEVS